MSGSEAATALRAGLGEAEAQEVVQDVMIAAAKKLPKFRYRPGKDSLKGWLLGVTRWKVADQFRKRKNGPDFAVPGEEAGSASLPVTAPGCQAPEEFEAIWDAEWAQHLLTPALARLKRHGLLHYPSLRSAEGGSSNRDVFPSGVTRSRPRAGTL